MLLDFPSEEGATWSPAFATALLILLTNNFLTPCLVKKNMAAGNLVLELLSEMDGWAWVSAFEEVIVARGGDPEEKVISALNFIGILLLLAPCYLSLNYLIRDRFYTSSKLKSKLATFDACIVGYVLGFALQVLFGAVVYQMISKRDLIKEYILFSIELFLVAVIVFYLEKLRTRASTSSDHAVAAAVTMAVEIAERALSVALGFAWLHAFKMFYINVNPNGTSSEADDATWLESSNDGGEEHDVVQSEEENDEYYGYMDDVTIKNRQEQNEELAREIMFLKVFWLLLVFAVIVLLHSFLETIAQRQKLKEIQEDADSEALDFNVNLAQTRLKNRRIHRKFRRTERRMRIACLSLAFGFAMEKVLGDILFHGFGRSTTSEIWASVLKALFVLVCLAVRRLLARKNCREPRSQENSQRRPTAEASDCAQRMMAIDSESDSDHSDEEIHNNGEGTFEISNEMWRGSMVEMTANGNQTMTTSTVISQPTVQKNIPLGPFADSGESDWHYDLCCSCSPASCIRCTCCSNTRCCHCGFPCIQAYTGCYTICCGCNNIPLGHL
jgi:hypothetical protein